MKFLYIGLFFLSSNFISSQIKIIDSETKAKIAFVEMYSENGDILGTTNYNGEISNVQLNNIRNNGSKQLYFHHNNYQSKNISIKEISNSDIISLVQLKTEKLNVLDEVVLFSKSNKKYIKFTAYFRNIQFNDSQPQYYMDGIVEFYISNKNGKAKIFVLRNRSLKDTSIKQIDEKGLVQLDFNIAGVPNFEDFIDLERVKKEYQSEKFGNNLSINKEGLEIGKIEIADDNLFLNLEIYSPENPKVMKLFGTESILKNYTVNAVYERNESVDILKDLLYFKEYRQYDIKQKKDKIFTYINCINEVFIIDRELTDDEPSSKDSFYSFIDKSNYEKSFWENIKSNYITQIPKTVEQFIKSKLSE